MADVRLRGGPADGFPCAVSGRTVWVIMTARRAVPVEKAVPGSFRYHRFWRTWRYVAGTGHSVLERWSW